MYLLNKIFKVHSFENETSYKKILMHILDSFLHVEKRLPHFLCQSRISTNYIVLNVLKLDFEATYHMKKCHSVFSFYHM